MLDIVKDADNDNGVVLTEKRPGKFGGSDLLRQKQGKRGKGEDCKLSDQISGHRPPTYRVQRVQEVLFYMFSFSWADLAWPKHLF